MLDASEIETRLWDFSSEEVDKIFKKVFSNNRKTLSFGEDKDKDAKIAQIFCYASDAQNFLEDLSELVQSLKTK